MFDGLDPGFDLTPPGWSILFCSAISRADFPPLTSVVNTLVLKGTSQKPRYYSTLYVPRFPATERKHKRSVLSKLIVSSFRPWLTGLVSDDNAGFGPVS